MTELYLLRHGIAAATSMPGAPDEERPLTQEGEKHIHEIARGLKRMDLELDRIIASPARRAWKTAEIVADVLDLTDRLEPADDIRPDRDAASIGAWLRTRTEGRLMLVGHNPSLSELIGLLLLGKTGVLPVELRKGGIAALSSRGNSVMTLDWLARPRLFRHLLKD